MLRRLVLPVLTVVLLISAAVPASAARRSTRVRHISRISVQADGHGSVIAVTYASGPRQHVKFLHSPTAIDRIALTDVDRNGEQDIIAAPHDGDLLIWRNRGMGRFTLGTLTRNARALGERGPRVVRFVRTDDLLQWSDERYDAAMPRAPSVSIVVLAADVALPLSVPAPLISLRSPSGRAPPSLA
jgi:hypothetical protein